VRAEYPVYADCDHDDPASNEKYTPDLVTRLVFAQLDPEQDAESRSSIAPATRTAGLPGSIATSGSHAPLRGYGLDGLPDETKLSATATPGSSMKTMTTNAAGAQRRAGAPPYFRRSTLPFAQSAKRSSDLGLPTASLTWLSSESPRAPRPSN
jgi:hypothetical protein